MAFFRLDDYADNMSQYSKGFNFNLVVKALILKCLFDEKHG